MAKLLDAGLLVLTERGYHAARVDDVVRVAKMSHGTFYLYFANKEDLFRALASECAEEMTALASTLGPITPDGAGRDELAQWLGRFVETYRRYGAVIRAWMEDQVVDRELIRLGLKAFERDQHEPQRAPWPKPTRRTSERTAGDGRDAGHDRTAGVLHLVARPRVRRRGDRRHAGDDVASGVFGASATRRRAATSKRN